MALDANLSLNRPHYERVNRAHVVEPSTVEIIVRHGRVVHLLCKDDKTAHRLCKAIDDRIRATIVYYLELVQGTKAVCGIRLKQAIGPENF
ncbi:MAG: hypothetical protein WC227_01420 [Patescibacteria group bacterium]|jgi:hypothetical protein